MNKMKKKTNNIYGLWGRVVSICRKWRESLRCWRERMAWRWRVYQRYVQTHEGQQTLGLWMQMALLASMMLQMWTTQHLEKH